MTIVQNVTVRVDPRPGTSGPDASDPLVFSYGGAASADGNIDLTAIKDDVTLVFDLETTSVSWRGVPHAVRLSRDKGARETLWIRPVGQPKGPTSTLTFQFLDFRHPAQSPRAVSVTTANSKAGFHAYGIEVELATGNAAAPWRRVRHDPQIKNGGNPNVINVGSIRFLQVAVVTAMLIIAAGFLLQRLLP